MQPFLWTDTRFSMNQVDFLASGSLICAIFHSMIQPAHHYSRDFKNIERIRLGVKALIIHQGKILVVKERVPYNGSIITVHDFPGGGLDAGEMLEAGLRREVFEEVGLKIKVGKLLGTWDFVVPKNSDPTTALHIVCLGYQCGIDGNTTEIDVNHNPAQEDIFEAVWMTKEEILAKENPVFVLDDLLETIKKVKF